MTASITGAGGAGGAGSPRRRTQPETRPRALAGVQLIAANAPELRRLLRELAPEDLDALDPELGAWMRRPLGREALTMAVLPAAGSVYLALLSLEIGGLIVVERGDIAARVRALAVAPDLRRRGLARSMLALIEPFAAERDVRWLWMSIAAGNAAATQCALRNGFRRYRPQFMLRERAGVLNVSNAHIRLERLDEARALDEVTRWIEYESTVGDAWCAELAQADLLKWLAPHGGEYYLVLRGDRDIGLLHLRHQTALSGAHSAQLTLWLEQAYWGEALEREAFKASLDMLADLPARIELAFGSGGHLRASAESFKTLAFAPALFDRVTFVRQLGVGDSDESAAIESRVNGGEA